jgi:hypothetical protein
MVRKSLHGDRRASFFAEKEDLMKATDGIGVKRTFLDIPNAAEMAGFSVRHFRRIIEDERIRIVQIGRKFFILGADFERWQSAKKLKAS